MAKTITKDLELTAAKRDPLPAPRQKTLCGVIRTTYRPTPFKGVFSWLESLQERGITIFLDEVNEDGVAVPKFACANGGLMAEDWQVLRNNRAAIVAALSGR